jgi:hypothetical protein
MRACTTALFQSKVVLVLLLLLLLLQLLQLVCLAPALCRRCVRAIKARQPFSRVLLQHSVCACRQLAAQPAGRHSVCSERQDRCTCCDFNMQAQ